MTDTLRQELAALGRDQANHERFELAFARLLALPDPPPPAPAPDDLADPPPAGTTAPSRG